MEAENLERLLCLLEVRVNAVGLCQVADGWRLKLPPKDDVLVHYIIRGSGHLRTGDGVYVPFRPATLIFIPPGLGQELFHTGDEPHVMNWRDTARGFGEGMIKLEAGAGEASLVSACGIISADCGGLNLFEDLREPIAEDVSDLPEVGAAFSWMLRELESARFGSRALSEAIMKQALILALRGQIERGEFSVLPLKQVSDRRLVKALVRMLEQPAEELTLASLAQVSGMSRSLFAERFAEELGCPPMELLKQIRLRRAASLLKDTNLPVQIVGTTVGYGSRSYFSRAFRAAYGTDPKTFRSQNHEISRPRVMEG